VPAVGVGHLFPKRAADRSCLLKPSPAQAATEMLSSVKVDWRQETFDGLTYINSLLRLGVKRKTYARKTYARKTYARKGYARKG